MIKRPLNPEFSSAVLEGRKITTIREKPWPVGKPIMLYNWSGAAYRSKQIDVAAVVVDETGEIDITHREDGGMIYAGRLIAMFLYKDGTRLHSAEGFDSRQAMDDWFRSVVKPGQTVTKHLMRFRLLNA
jgi:hypothetical protein